MMRRILKLKAASALSCLMAALLVWPMTAVVAQSQSNLFSGQAFVVQATVPPISSKPLVTLSDTGFLDSTGGAKEASFLETGNVSIGTVGNLNASVLHAATVGQGNHSRSEASVANLNLTVAGNNISADFLMSRAEAACSNGQASVSGSSEIVNLTINNLSINVSGQPNQTVLLPAGTGEVIINEQQGSVSGNTGAVTVNALHVIVSNPLLPGNPTIADVVISSAHADITCAAPPPGGGGGAPPPGGGGGVPPGCQGDFITGGGWITTPSGAKANFAVAGGIKSGAFWGHLNYIDHGTGMKVKGTGVTAYTTTGTTSRHIEGTCEINGQPGNYQVDVADNGEPGRNVDTFALKVSTGYNASGFLQGGNIQLHVCK